MQIPHSEQQGQPNQWFTTGWISIMGGWAGSHSRWLLRGGYSYSLLEIIMCPSCSNPDPCTDAKSTAQLWCLQHSIACKHCQCGTNGDDNRVTTIHYWKRDYTNNAKVWTEIALRLKLLFWCIICVRSWSCLVVSAMKLTCPFWRIPSVMSMVVNLVECAGAVAQMHSI